MIKRQHTYESSGQGQDYGADQRTNGNPRRWGFQGLGPPGQHYVGLRGLEPLTSSLSALITAPVGGSGLCDPGCQRGPRQPGVCWRCYHRCCPVNWSVSTSLVRKRVDFQVGHWAEMVRRYRRWLRTYAGVGSLKAPGVDHERQVGAGRRVTSRRDAAWAAHEMALDGHQVDDGLPARCCVAGRGRGQRPCVRGDYCRRPRNGMAPIQCHRPFGYCSEPVNRRHGYRLAGLGNSCTVAGRHRRPAS